MRVASSDYMNTSILDSAYDTQLKLKNLMYELLNRTVFLSEPDTSLQEYTTPFPELINIIERNIDILTAGGYTPSNMLPTVDWQGELFDNRRLSYYDVNRWFESSEKITGLLYGIIFRSPVTGTFYTGSNRTRQLIRTVK